MRDPKTGKFLKRVKQALTNSQPATLDYLLPLPDEGKKEVSETDMKLVSVDVVPTKLNARQSARRSKTMSATITIIGNLTSDPELRQTNSGKSVVNFALAYTPRRPDGSDGQTSFYNITAWEFLADNMVASFKKGDRLVVVGRVSQDKWTDKDSDKVMTRLVITADEIGGTCRFHTVEMTKIQRAAKVSEPVEGEQVEETEDIFA
jgi:single-strand DNA-binding protein